MTRPTGFKPIADSNATVLILGSMPSVASLQAQHYYAHPRNTFWPIMAALFDAAPISYPQWQTLLIGQGIAVWDVLQSCHRPGSLDANIDLKTVQMNDFVSFYRQHQALSRVFFNGGMADKLYRQRILPIVGAEFAHLHYLRLPSTSPAYSAMTLPQKIAAWQVIKQTAPPETVIK